MKKTLVSTILGLATVAATFAQGQIQFNNYINGPIVYGPSSGGTLGTGINNTFKAGLFYALGTVVWTDGTGVADPSTGGFQLNPVTATFAAANVGNTVGQFDGGNATINPYVSGPVTFVVVAYNGLDYASSLVRGHSSAFTVPSLATGLSLSDPMPAGPGGFEPFAVTLVPEPSTFALAGLGLASLLIFRRRK